MHDDGVKGEPPDNPLEQAVAPWTCTLEGKVTLILELVFKPATVMKERVKSTLALITVVFEVKETVKLLRVLTVGVIEIVPSAYL